MSWTVVDALRASTEYLTGKGIENPRLNAELLLGGILDLKRLDLYLQHDRPLRPEELAAYRSRLSRRARREPLQYIEGEAAFRELRLQVDAAVLIPRPETEVLVGEVLSWGAGRGPLEVLDVGTGSGAIVLSLIAEGEIARAVATDVSAAALAVAKRNRAAVAPAAPLEFRVGAGYAPLAGERFDAIVSNPPYIAESERAGLEPEVGEWEPQEALFAGAEGLAVIAELVRGAPEHLRPGGLLALEVGHGQPSRVAEMIRETGRFVEPRVRPDLTGRERIVLAELRKD